MVTQTVKELIYYAKIALEQAGIENFQMEAYLLIEKVTGVKKFEMPFKENEVVTPSQIELLNKFLKRRENGEPLQYILGEWEFYGLNFKVGQGVLIPRQDTETLVDVVLEELKGIENPCIIDLCSGSGCIAISLEKKLANSKVYAVELSMEAIPYLLKNIVDNNSKVEVINGDVLDENILSSLPMCDCIVSNPPYLTKRDMLELQKEVEFEPAMALAGGDDGLIFYRKIAKMWGKKLKQNGLIAFEIGINQENDVTNILEENGYKNVSVKKDLCEINRVVFARKS